MRFRKPLAGTWAKCVLFLMITTTARAATLTVAAGGDLQAALNAAQAGDIVALQPGATFTGNFVLPNKGAISDYITVRSAAPDRDLPPPGIRITPAAAPLLAKLKSPSSTPVLRTAAGANHWKILFVEFQANANGYGDIVTLGAGDSSQTQLSQVPYALVIDRVYVHGDAKLGQKRGIALHSSDTVVINSYVSDCKAVGQDSQAISGFNGPGNYVIENNFLEGAAENFLLGGADPTIPNLVTTNVVFRRNLLRKPLEWRDPIIATPVGVSATVAAGSGSLAAGTYYYEVVARRAAGQTNKATSTPSVEVSATVPYGSSGGITISWTPVAGADDYLVYGRTAGTENVYWKTTNPYFADSGAAGTTGTPGTKATKWSVKNIFELKNAQDVLVEGNVFENLWVADQPGYPIVFTPRNQNGHASWVVVQRVMFRHNIVRHTAGGVNILGIDNVAPTQRTNNISVVDNVFDDLTASAWGTGSRPFQLGDGPDAVTIDHNTIITTDSAIVWLYGGPTTSPTPSTNVRITNNMSAHNSYGIDGSGYQPGITSITAYLPGGTVLANVLAGGSASRYPPGNYFPTVTAWQSEFTNYAAGDYHLGSASPFKGGATDGSDLGANIDTVTAETANALTGDDSVAPNTTRVRIMTTSLPNGTLYQPYAQLVSCSGGSGTGTCGWRVLDGLLPAGITFDAVAALIAGTPRNIETGSIMLEAHDATYPSNSATATLTVTIDPPPFVMNMPAASAGQVGVAYRLAPSVAGALGTVTWTVATGNLPSGLNLDAFSGLIAGVPTTWGTTTAVIEARDSWRPDRVATAPITITVAPAPLAVSTAVLPRGNYRSAYQARLTATGGTGQTTWALAGGALPRGLALASNGTISGVPMAVGTFGFAVRASDAGWSGNVAQKNLAITVGAREILLYASDATTVSGTWARVPDATAAGGTRLANPDKGAAKLVAPLASPLNYFEIQFEAEAGLAYHLWVRGKAENNFWGNDSVMVQFSNSVDASGAAKYRIGTTSGSDVNLEDCSGCGLSGWGWQDNGWGVNVMGPAIYFGQSGPQTIRVQVREDGMSIDQIVLSAGKYATVSPGALKNDTTILPR
jgi:hypothetical protein